MLPVSRLLSRAATLLVLAIAAGPSLAQLRLDPSAWGTGSDGIRVRPEELPDLHVTPEKAIDPYAYRRGLFSSLGLYEYKRPGEVQGQYAKPHYALGLHSDAMRSALALTGLDTESCVAPMVRLRAREASVTGANGVSVSMFARCTFR